MAELKIEKFDEYHANRKYRVLFENPHSMSFVWKSVLANKPFSRISFLVRSLSVDVFDRIAYRDLDDARQTITSSNLLIFLSRSVSRKDWPQIVEIAEHLIQRGLDVNDCESNLFYGTHNTALTYALQRGNAKLVKLLFKHGAVIEVLGWTTFLPRYAQYWMTNPDEILPLLFRYVDGPNKIEFVKMMAMYDVPQTGFKDELGCTPLYYSLKIRNHLLASRLVAKGADVNALIYGITPLVYATIISNIILMKLLLENGARIDEPSGPDKMTALHYACQYRFLSKINWLLKFGADPNVVDLHNRTPFQLLTDDNQVTIIDTCREIMLKEIAIKAFCGAKFHDHHLILRNPVYKAYFAKCLSELAIMKRTLIAGSISLLDVISSTEPLEKVEKLVGGTNLLSLLQTYAVQFYHYAHHLNTVRNRLLINRNQKWKVYENRMNALNEALSSCQQQPRYFLFISDGLTSS